MFLQVKDLSTLPLFLEFSRHFDSKDKFTELDKNFKLNNPQIYQFIEMEKTQNTITLRFITLFWSLILTFSLVSGLNDSIFYLISSSTVLTRYINLVTWRINQSYLH